MTARKKLALPAAPPAPTTTLTCHAPHPDPAKKGQPCGSPLGHQAGAFTFDTTAKQMPHEPDGYTWVRCPRGSCRAWNRFAPVAVVSPAVTPVPLETLEQRILALPLPRQIAAHALAGGLPASRVGEAVGVDERTVQRWNAEPDFRAIVLEIRPAITSTAVAAVMEDFHKAASANAAKGFTADQKWFLDRTMFFENKLSLARAAKQEGQSINVNVAIASIWEKRGVVPPGPNTGDDGE